MNTEKSKTTNAAARRPPQVLAVDDEPVNLVVIAAALAPLGYQIVAAGDAPAAMAAMLGERPDVVLLDVMMPGESGLELCRKMRSHPTLADIPVILVTALGAAGNRTRGLRSGADDFIEKPIDIDQLVDRVRSVIARGAGTSPGHIETAAAPRRRTVHEDARRGGFDAPTADLIAAAAALYQAAVESGAGHQAPEVADAMARAAGLPLPSSIAGRVASTADQAAAVDAMISGGNT